MYVYDPGKIGKGEEAVAGEQTYIEQGMPNPLLPLHEEDGAGQSEEDGPEAPRRGHCRDTINEGSKGKAKGGRAHIIEIFATCLGPLLPYHRQSRGYDQCPQRTGEEEDAPPAEVIGKQAAQNRAEGPAEVGDPNVDPQHLSPL